MLICPNNRYDTTYQYLSENGPALTGPNVNKRKTGAWVTVPHENQESERMNQDRREKYLALLALANSEQGRQGLMQAAISIIDELLNEQGNVANTVQYAITQAEYRNRAADNELQQEQRQLEQYGERGVPLPVSWAYDALNYPTAQYEHSRKQALAERHNYVQIAGGITPNEAIMWALANAEQAGARAAVAEAIRQLRVTVNAPETVCFDILIELQTWVQSDEDRLSAKSIERLYPDWRQRHITGGRAVSADKLADALTLAYQFQTQYRNRGIEAFARQHNTSTANIEKFETYLRNVRKYARRASKDLRDKWPEILAGLSE